MKLYSYLRFIPATEEWQRVSNVKLYSYLMFIPATEEWERVSIEATSFTEAFTILSSVGDVLKASGQLMEK